MKGIKNVFLLVTGFLTCPCHLPFLLPVLAGLLAGTAVGAFITENIELLIVLATVYFAGVVIYFLSAKRRERSSKPLEGVRE